MTPESMNMTTDHPSSAPTASEPVLRVEDLRVRFRPEDRPDFLAVKGISFAVPRAQTVAIVGESGSGKSVTAMALTRLLPEPPAHIESGKIWLTGRDLLSLAEPELRRVRGKEIAYIFQDPMSSLNPVHSLRTQIGEMIKRHRTDIRGAAAIDDEIVYWLDQVGIVNPRARLHSYPHELSGGMQQRAMIAMALSARPHLLVADEPTTALDATVQHQIMDLLARLQAEHQMSILLITHNFHILRHVAHEIVVMFRGEIVECGPTEKILNRAEHPYSRALADCVPRIGPKRHRLTSIDHAALA
jgi:ABC-type dipeptide/oligopeptide/nickel transport system ATPase component